MSSISSVNNSSNYQTVISYTPQAQTQTQNSATVVDNADGNASVDNSADVQQTSETAEKTVIAQENGQDANIESNTEKIEEENQKIRDSIATINKKIASNTEAVFGVHDETNRITIKIVDKDTKKVIKELPPEKTLDMIAKVWELAGLIVDEKR